MKTLDSLLTAEWKAAWEATEGCPESTLIRLAILRSIARELHARRSKLLAAGAEAETRLAAWEKRLERLRERRAISGKLQDALDGAELASADTVKRRPPRALFDLIPQEKLERYDRVWEREIVSEALAIGWSVHETLAELPTQEVEGWQHRLERELAPDAVLLFVEAAVSPAGLKAGTWQGRWWWVVRPGFCWPTHFENVELDPERSFPRAS